MLFKYHLWQSQWAGTHQSTCPCPSARSSKASIFTTAYYAEPLAGLSPKWGEKGKQTQNFIECHQAWAVWFVSTEILLQGSSSWIWLSWCPLDSSAESSWVWGHKKEQSWFLGIQWLRESHLFFLPLLATWWCYLRMREDRLRAWKKAHCPHSIKTTDVNGSFA